MMQPLRSTLTDTLYPYTTLLRFYYEQISDVTRDQKITEQANAALGEVIRRYPGSRYAADARLKMDLVQDHLAGKEMEIGRSDEHTSELQSLMRQSDAVLCLKKNKKHATQHH